MGGSRAGLIVRRWSQVEEEIPVPIATGSCGYSQSFEHGLSAQSLPRGRTILLPAHREDGARCSRHDFVRRGYREMRCRTWEATGAMHSEHDQIRFPGFRNFQNLLGDGPLFHDKLRHAPSFGLRRNEFAQAPLRRPQQFAGENQIAGLFLRDDMRERQMRLELLRQRDCVACRGGGFRAEFRGVNNFAELAASRWIGMRVRSYGQHRARSAPTNLLRCRAQEKFSCAGTAPRPKPGSVPCM
jgi:hypothetical protein